MSLPNTAAGANYSKFTNKAGVQDRIYNGSTITIARHIRKGFRTNYVIFIDGVFAAQTTPYYSFDAALSAARKQIDSKASTQTTISNNSLTLQKVG